jgi:hypothetical protein
MSISKDQLRDLFEAQPQNLKVRNILVRTKEGEFDFEELVIEVDFPVAVPSK